MEHKRGQVSAELTWLIIGIALVVIAIIAIVLIKTGATSQISNFLNQMRFGR
jgi:uncharacterized protein (UPF0333 family)